MCVGEGFMEVFTTIPLWFMILLIVATASGIWLRSIMLCIAAIIMSIVACVMLYDITGVTDFVRYGLMAIFLSISGAMVFQLIFSVKRI